MKIIQRAKFYQTGTLSSRAYIEDEAVVRDGREDIVQPAIIDLDGFRFSSAVPATAAEAAKINARIEQWAQYIPELVAP